MGKLTTLCRLVLLGVAAGAALVAAACRSDASPTASVAAVVSQPDTPVPTITTQPTFAAEPSDTPAPTLVPANTPTSAPTSAPTPAPRVSDCTPDAAFQADVTIPDNTRIEIGESFAKTWRIGNTGTCEWGSSYHLDFAGGDQLGGPAAVAVANTLPNGSADVSVEMVAPAAPGTYRGEWQMYSDEGGPFGGVFYVQIVAFDASASVPEPTEPAAEVAAILRIIAVDKGAEFVDIQNQGDQPQDLSGWTLVSEKGNQACALGSVIGPGEVLRIWAMAEDADQGGFNCAFGSAIWNNSEKDPAVLYDAAGQEVSRY